MSYGAPIQYAMTDGYIPPSPYNIGGSAPSPDISIKPMQDASTSALGRRNTINKRLPSMPGGEMGDLSYTNYGAEQAALQNYALGVAGAERKEVEQRSRKIARAKNRQAQRIAEKRTRLR